MCKILYFLDDGQAFGGAANTLLQQAVLMKKAQNDVAVVISNYQYNEIAKGYFEICKKCNIDIFRAPFQISSQPEDIDVVCLIEHYFAVAKIIKDYAPDILHSIQINPIVELVSRDLRIPHIMNIYPLISDFFSIKYIDIFPHYHICDSQYYADKWMNYLHTDSCCIRTVVNQKGSIKTNLLEGEQIHYLCVGHIYKEKNQLSVIQAFHKALDKGIKGTLEIYGYDSGTYAEQCRQYIVENNLQHYIKIEGFRSDMLLEYRHGDVLICGSTRESYPNVISEAMANGLVIISTPVGGVSEVIRDGHNGYLCNDYSVDSILEKIMQLENDRKNGQLKKVLDNTYNTFMEVHSPESITRKLLSYYQYVSKTGCLCKDIGINNIRDKFKSIINTYNNNKKFFSEPYHVQLKLWYIYHVSPILNDLYKKKRTKIYIWGTGKYARSVKEIVEVFFQEFEVVGFIDTYKKGVYEEKHIFSPAIIQNNLKSIVFVGAINGQDEIITELELAGKSFNRDYFILSRRRW